jgi:hypothetical protein
VGEQVPDQQPVVTQLGPHRHDRVVEIDPAAVHEQQ